MCDLDCAMTELHSESREAVGIQVPKFMNDLWHKKNTTVWLELHDFVQQTQNLIIIIGMQPPTINQSKWKLSK